MAEPVQEDKRDAPMTGIQEVIPSRDVTWPSTFLEYRQGGRVQCIERLCRRLNRTGTPIKRPAHHVRERLD